MPACAGSSRNSPRSNSTPGFGRLRPRPTGRTTDAGARRAQRFVLELVRERFAARIERLATEASGRELGLRLVLARAPDSCRARPGARARRRGSRSRADAGGSIAASPSTAS